MNHNLEKETQGELLALGNVYRPPMSSEDLDWLDKKLREEFDAAGKQTGFSKVTATQKVLDRCIRLKRRGLLEEFNSDVKIEL